MKKTQLKTFRDIRLQRYQFGALILIVTLGVASFIGLIAAYRNLDQSYNQTYDRLHFADATLVLEGSAPTQAVDEIAQLPGVAAVEGRLVIDTGLWLSETDRGQARLIGLPVGDHPSVNDVHVEEGRYFRQDDESESVLLVEHHFADFHKLSLGTPVYPIVNGERVALESVGVAASPEYLILALGNLEIMGSARRFAVLFLPETKLQTLFQLEDQINQISLLVTDPTLRSEVISEAKEILAPYRIRETVLQENQPSNSMLQLDLDGYRELAWMLPALILLAAAMSVYITLSRMIQSQRPQIGLFKALGYTSQTVLIHYLLFSLTIALIGTALGLAMGQGLSGAVTRIYATELGIPFVETALYPTTWIEGALLSLIFCGTAGLLPARAATKIKPADAMRLDPSVAQVQGSIPIIEKIITRFVSLPLTSRIPLRNLFRNRRRTLSTTVGLTFAFILLLGTWAFIDSMDHMLDLQYQKIERWDMAVEFSTLQPGSLANEISNWAEVTLAEPTLQLPGILRNEEGSEVIIETWIVALDPLGILHQLQLQKGMDNEAALRSEHAVLTSNLAEELKVNPGDRVNVETPWASGTFTISAISEELLGGILYLPLPDLFKLAGSPTPWLNGLYLSVDVTQVNKVRTDLYRIAGTSNVQIKEEILADWRELLSLFFSFMGVMLAFALIMSFAIVFNTVMVNVLERQREIGTMRTLGTEHRQIIKLITIENLLGGLLSVVPGLLLGVIVAYGLMESFSTELFTMQMKIYPLSFVAVAGGILVTILISQWPALRRLNRLDLAEVTKVLT